MSAISKVYVTTTINVWNMAATNLSGTTATSATRSVYVVITMEPPRSLGYYYNLQCTIYNTWCICYCYCLSPPAAAPAAPVAAAGPHPPPPPHISTHECFEYTHLANFTFLYDLLFHEGIVAALTETIGTQINYGVVHNVENVLRKLCILDNGSLKNTCEQASMTDVWIQRACTRASSRNTRKMERTKFMFSSSD